MEHTNEKLLSVKERINSKVVPLEKKMKLIEHIQEFNLPKHFPSTVQEAKCIAKKQRIIQLPILNMTNFIPVDHTKPLIPYKKLRIVTPDGKDLGEFNVDIRKSQSDPSKKHIFTITKSNTFKPINESLISPLQKASIPRRVPLILKHGSMMSKKKELSQKTHDDKYILNNGIINQVSLKKLQPTALPIKKISMIDRVTETNKKIQKKAPIFVDTTNVKHSTNCINCIADDDDRRSTDSRCKLMLTKSNKCLDNINTQSTLVAPTTSAENDKIFSNEKNVFYKMIAESPFPKVSCQKLPINFNNDNYIKTQFKAYNKKYLDITKNVRNEEPISSSASSSVREHVEINRDKSHSSTNDKNAKRDQEDSEDLINFSLIKSGLIYENKQTYQMKVDENALTILDNLLFDKTASYILEHNIDVNNTTNCSTVTLNTNHAICNDTQSERLSIKELENDNSSLVMQHLESEEMMHISENVHSDKLNENNFKDLFQLDLSDQWSIINKAVNSVKDEKLRTLALKALANCTKMKKCMSIEPSEESHSIHDTRMQSAMLGLSNPKFSISSNKNLDNIQRMEQIIPRDMPDFQDLLLNEELQLDNNLVVETPDQAIEQQTTFDIEDFMHDFCKENLNACKVRKTLSEPTMRCKKIFEQLEKDYKTIKEYNQVGMLNIHNAVVRNNIFDVQRHLLVLKQCKVSVDVPTTDEATSLELAIKYDVCSEIVKRLLEAGAQPVIQKSLHDSAVIIAAKRSSPLLLMLINYVKDRELFDQMDSEGLAALHYCCLRNNEQGVSALLSAGANINLKDMRSGRTPLFHALDKNHKKLAQKLLHEGAIANIANFTGQTALALTLANEMKNASFEISQRSCTL